MQLRLRHLAIVLPAIVVLAPVASAQIIAEDSLDVDILVSYYDQDGDHSPVTGGVGTEDLQVISPVLMLNWRKSELWTFSADLGLDQMSSASIGNIQMELSSASIPASDTRTFGNFRAARSFGNQTLGLSLGAATEYDYESFSYGLDWGMELNQSNTAISAAVRRYDDAIDLVGIDGYGSRGQGRPPMSGQADRTTTDLYFSVSQVFSKRTTGAIDVFLTNQDGYLATPFHEVILAPDPSHPAGRHVAERLPDSRDRQAITLRLNHAFSDSIVQRVNYRYYDDDWGITAQSIELETHFRLPGARTMWVYPILRYHTQTAADYFGLPETFTLDDPYFSSDWDLAETTTQKFGLGWTVAAPTKKGWFLDLDRFEVRGTFYDRDDGLQGFTTSFGFGWTF